MQKYKFIFEVTQPFYADIFLGSRWRSILITAVKKAVCFNTRLDDCSKCIAYKTCAYPYYFSSETKINNKTIKKPNPYIIQTDSCEIKHYYSGMKIEVSLVLLDKAVNYINLLIHNLKYIRIGSCEKKYNLKLQEVSKYNNFNENKIIWSNNEFADVDDIKFEACKKYQLGKYKLSFYSPLRILQKGKFITEITSELFINLIKRKLKSYKSFYNIPITNDEIDSFNHSDIIICSNSLYKYDWYRYSSRQEKTMMLDGVLGDIEINILNSELTKALYFCSLLGLGKGSSLGLGQFKLEIII